VKDFDWSDMLKELPDNPWQCENGNHWENAAGTGCCCGLYRYAEVSFNGVNFGRTVISSLDAYLADLKSRAEPDADAPLVVEGGLRRPLTT
jgi:hypothetical protein